MIGRIGGRGGGGVEVRLAPVNVNEAEEWRLMARVGFRSESP